MSTLKQKLNFVTRKNLSNKHRDFNKLKMWDNMVFNIYTLKQK